MKKLLSYIMLIIVAATYCVLIESNTALAFSSYQDCLNQSGGYENISSVQWACSGGWDGSEQYCTLWLGDGYGETVIYSNNLSGSVTAYFWGMCTYGTNTTHSITASNDNDSIDDNKTLTRGTWGNPTYVSTSIDIGKFVSGLTPSISGDYMTYSRLVNIARCHSGGNSCSSQDQLVSVKVYAPPTTFDGKVELTSISSAATYNSSKGKYYIDADTISFTFTDSMKRNNDGKSGNVSNGWWAYQDSNSSSYDNGSKSYAKNSGWQTVKTHTRNNVSLSPGDNTFCEKLGFNNTISYSGTGSGWTTKEKCITVHRYIWYSWDGKVVPSASGSSSSVSSGITYVDGNTAEMSFSHQLKKNGGSVKTLYKTSRSNTPTTFSQQGSYTNAGLSSNNIFTEVYRSPSSGTKTVNVAKDNGTEYCQILYWYQYTREDRGDSDTSTSKIKTEKNTKGCKTIRRYKTTFSGTIKVEYKAPGGSWTTVYTAGASEISPGSANFKTYDISGENIPTSVEVRFTHTVTRSSSDAHGSPNNKKSYFITNLDGTTGYRAGDPHGTAVTTAKNTNDLAAGGSDTHVDTFTVKLYPEQEITLCQKLTYKSEIQGADDTATGTAGRRCFKLTKKQVSCQGVEYGIKNAKNYLTMQMYKNGSEDNSSGRLDTTKSGEMVTWVKPGDSVRFKYTMCAAGELASQFADKYITNYIISTDTSGYLFGKTVNDSPYTATSKTIGTSNATPGVGPFPNGTSASHKYEYTTTSPSDDADDMYKCNGGLSDYYTIPGIRPNDPDIATLRTNCSSDDYGYVSDVGKSFTQTATWSDIWYSNGSAVSGHTGGNATVTGRVNVPYNYFTRIKTTATGGNVVLGQTIGAQVSIKISPRTNGSVQATAYSTYSKPTRYRLVEVIIPATSSLMASTYNNDIAAQEYSIADSRGTLTITSQLNHCRDRGVICNIKKQADDINFAGDDIYHNIEGSDYSFTIPDQNSGTYQVGTKICYIAAVWPSDSHGFDSEDTEITDNNQSNALTDGGTRWHVSKPSCFTVVKRPTMAALGGDLYAPAGILGVTTKRSANNSGTDKKLFGTWGEYGLVSGTSKNTSKGEIKGVASGASLWGGGSTSNTITRECYFSSMTFANANCSSNNLGKVPIDTTAASYPERLAEQIRTRYTDPTNNDAKTSQSEINGGGACVYDANSNSYIADYLNANSRFVCLPSGAKYIHATANVAYIKEGINYCMIKGDTINSRTAVFEADHTLIIGTNTVYGNTTNKGYGTVPGTGCYKEQYSSISEIPQNIYIADKIIIKDNVERIDSWLIANEIYTCDPRSGYKSVTNASDPLNRNTINAGNCTKQLTINGPVITKNLHLYRTGGGDGWSTNSKPAEIFYLGPEAYLWSYNQAQRYSQAITTYQREVAPRY